MKSYLDIVERVLTRGKFKGNRTGIRTLACANVHFEHEMSEGFPLLTTKKMPIKTLSIELEGFINGITSKKWYQDRGCRIWDEWANPKKVDNRIDEYCEEIKYGYSQNIDRKPFQEIEDDLGPIYGYQWRAFNKTYVAGGQNEDDGDWNHYADQLKDLVDKLHNNPDDRRLVVSAWNPNQIKYMALPPCHLLFVCTHIDGVLNLHWTQRSCDLMLGVPFNIASYAILLELLCKEGGFTPGNLSGMLCDCHIYENQIEVAKEQLKREPKPLPKIQILSKLKEIYDAPGGLGFEDDGFSIFDWTHKDLKLVGYESHPKLDFGPVAV